MEEDFEPGPGHIDLDKTPQLRIDYFNPKDRFIAIRDEYSAFLKHVEANPSSSTHYFESGQPGIGKSVALTEASKDRPKLKFGSGKSIGNGVTLFHLLAASVPVFAIGLRDNTNIVYHFSEAGVFRGDQADDIVEDLKTAYSQLKNSWVLINVDRQPTYKPPTWPRHARHTIWTSSPNPKRLRYFIYDYVSEVWFIQLWTEPELELLRFFGFLILQQPKDIF